MTSNKSRNSNSKPSVSGKSKRIKTPGQDGRSEELFRSMLENSRDVIYCLNAQTGHYEYISPSAEEVSGFSSAELMSMDVETALSMIHHEDRSAIRTAITQLEETGKADVEYRQLTKTGEFRWLSNSMSLTRDDKGMPLYRHGNIRDITESKRAERVLRESDKKFRFIATNIPDTLFFQDKDLRYVWIFNPVDPLSESDVVGKTDFDLLPFEEAERLTQIKRRVLETGIDVKMELQLSPGGITRSYEAVYKPFTDHDGRSVGVVSYSRDITDRKRDEEKLREAVERYEQQFRLFDGIASTTPDFVYVFDLQGHFLYANRRLLEVWGMELADVIGKTTRDLGYEQWHHDMHMREIGQVKKTKLPIKGEVPFKAPRTGLFGVYEYIFTPVIGPAGTVELIAGTTRDVTDRKRAEEERERLISELEATIRELEGFTYTISHDLRAPVRHIAGFSELLKQALWQDLDESKRTYITTISKSAERLGVMIDELLNFSRMGRAELKKEAVDLNKIVLDAIGELKEHTLSRAVEWRIDDLPRALGDATMLHFVFSNLISNAVKFTSSREDTSIEIGYREEEDRHIIFIRDNGVGFDMAHYDKLFGVFHRLHDQRDFEGTGIGLANVQRIIHRHGGDVWAESKINEGATFYFSLPKVNNK